MNKYQREFMNNMHGFKRMRLASVVPGFNSGELMMMRVIHDCIEESGKDSIRVSDIACHACFPMPAVSRSLGDLEKRGLIMRSMDPGDRRNTLVSMTPEGEKAEEDTFNTITEFMDEVFSVFSDDEMERFIDMQERLMKSFEDEIRKRKDEIRNDRKGNDCR